MLGILIALGVLGCATVASYIILNHFYGTAHVYAPRLENIVWENERSIYGGWTSEAYEPLDLRISPNYQSAPPGNTLIFDVTIKNSGDAADTYFMTALDDAGWDLVISDESVQVAVDAYENFRLDVGIPENSKYGENDKIILIASSLARPEAATGALCFARSGEHFAADIPIPPSAGAGLQPVITYEKPVAVLPIAVSIGIAMCFMVAAVWIGYRRMWGDAASTLLEQGLHNMTVRDVEIVGQIMDLKEFTIPELMRRTHVSKITAWRTVQKLIERGLVEPTERTKLAANGLGGRGKPSRVYKYIGERASKTSTER